MNVGGVTKAVLAPSSYGKVIIADDLNDTKAVKFTIDLTGTGQKIQEVDFNTVAALASATFAATAVDGSSTTLTVANKQDAVQADGYTTGKFDVEMPKNGSFGNVVEPLSFVLNATNLDLDASNFLALDTNGSLYVAVHIAACIATTYACDLGGSIWAVSDPVDVAQVDAPEPASIGLLAAGIIGMDIMNRRRRSGAAVY
jgi:hypothetical protein